MSEISFEGLVGCSAALVMGIRQWRHGIHRARLIEDVATSKVRSAAQGVAELIGTCREADGVQYHAPITGVPCTWYRYTIQRRVKHGKSSSWRTVVDEKSSSPFVLEDDTGQCTIHPEGAQITTTHKRTWSFGTGFGGSTGAQLAKLRKQTKVAGSSLKSVALDGLAVRGRIRVTQWMLCSGDPLYALGDFRTLRRDEEVAHTLREPHEERIHFLVSNLDQASIVAKHRRRGKWGLVMIVLGTAGLLFQGFVHLGN